MSAHTAYYHVPPYTQPAAIPQGWHPPFQGPPPIPSGMNINPQLWQAGRWQINHAYFAQHQGVPQPQHAWAASQAWQQSRSQESASKNPYKRTTKPPSAEYLATSLSDNPLGLTDMIPAEEYYAQQNANEMTNDSHRSGTAVAESPWIWNPPSLAPDEDDVTEPPSNSSTHDSSRPRTPSRSSSQRDSTTSQQPSNPSTEERKGDAFTSKCALVPTFSVNIVRTPEHYKSSPSRSSSRSSHTNRSSRSSTDPQQLISRMESLSTSDFSSSNSSQFTTPDTDHAQTMSGVHNLVEEPITSLLSPLLLTTPKPQSRPLGRYSTFPMVNGPASLDTIPEAPTTSKSDQHSLRHKSSTRHPSRVKTDPVVDSHHHNHSPNYPTSNSPYLNPSPSRSSRSSSSSHASSQQPSPTTSVSLSPHDYHTSPPTSGSSRHSNPLPAPPAEYSNHSFSLNTKGPTRSSKRKRKGFWNKRGDYFTRTGYVVYAPHDQAYPPELQDYPDESQGFVDENGQRLSLGPRPELPESVPRHGQPPKRPYHSFIEYV